MLDLNLGYSTVEDWTEEFLGERDGQVGVDLVLTATALDRDWAAGNMPETPQDVRDDLDAAVSILAALGEL